LAAREPRSREAGVQAARVDEQLNIRGERIAEVERHHGDAAGGAGTASLVPGL
jgi:hypothetical protein